MKKLSVFLISMSLLFVLSVSSNTNGGNADSQLLFAANDNQGSHPIQPPV
jgi:hypothetical protein